MRWTITSGDILMLGADVLVCSANIYLNLSGGVGGEILRRFGDAMQQELYGYLQREGRNFMQPADVVASSGCGTPFKAVLHAVAVDAFYRSSPEFAGNAVAKALRMAAEMDANSAALTALATGYGRLAMRQFAQGIRKLVASEFPPLRRVIACVRHDHERDELAFALSECSGR